MDQHFAYAIDRRYLPVLVPFGLRPAKDGVTLTDGSFLATFGFFRLTTPRTNITGAHITRNYRWWTAFGVRGSRVDDGLSFGTNHAAGVCIHFATKVPSPLRRSGHSALTVTVAETPQVSQPQPFSRGRTSVVPRTQIGVQEDGKKLAVVNEGVSLQQLVDGLNALGIGPLDMIAILQAIKAAGAIQADIEVM